MPRVRVAPEVAVHGLFVVFGFVIAAFFPFLAIYLESRGLSASQVGFVLAAMAVARVVANPIWGHQADTRIGRVTALRLGAIGSGAAALAVNAVEGLWAIAVVAALLAAAMVATGPNIDAITLVHLGDERMEEYGRIRAWESLSYAAGCLVFGAILQAAGLRWAMPLYATASLGVVAWTFTLDRDRPTRGQDHGRLGAVGAVFRAAPRLWGFLAATLLVWTGFNAAWNFISLKIASEGGGALLIGLGTALGGLVEVPVMRNASRLQAGWGLRRVFALGCLIYAGGFLAWGLIDSPTVVSVLTVFEGAAFALLFTTGILVIGRLVPSSLYSSGNSIAAMVGFGIAPIIGAGVGGVLYEHAGTVVLYAAASSLALLGGVITWFALDTPALDQPAPAEPVGLEAEPPPAPGEVVP
jgi:MFS transporter, PPP family, 3-phenylpropionic acid transporter